MPDFSFDPSNKTQVTSQLIKNETSPPSEGYRRDIDGLRAVAVLSVVLFHAGLPHLTGGFVGVDVFFVISGYLIGAHLYRDMNAGTFSIARFYARRAKRILPALFAVLVFCSLLGMLLLSSRELKSFGGCLFSTLFSVSNIYSWTRTGYFAAAAALNPLLMTWSLAVEEQFYIAFPLMMLLLASIRLRRMGSFRKQVLLGVGVVSGLSLIWSIIGTVRYPAATYYLPFGRAWELGCGILLAVFEAEAPFGRADSAKARFWANLRSSAGMLLILYAVFHYGPTTPFPGAAALAPVVGTVLLIASPNAWFQVRVLSLSFVRWIGLVSYSWYLWHWPLLSFARLCSDRGINWPIGLCITLVALCFAILSYRFIERPFRASRRPDAPLLLRYALTTLAFTCYALLLYASQGLPVRYPVLAAEEKQTYGFATNCLTPDSSPDPIMNSFCTPSASIRTIALWGDSHGVSIEANLRAGVQQSGMQLVAFSKVQCPPLYKVVPSSVSVRKDRACATWNDKVLQYIRQDPAISLVFLTGDWAGPKEWEWEADGYVQMRAEVRKPAQSDANLELGLRGLVRQLQTSGKQVVLIKDIEALRFDPIQRLRESRIPLRGWVDHRLLGNPPISDEASRDDLFFNQNQQAANIVDRVARDSGAAVFDLRLHLCTAGKFTYRDDNNLFYFDSNHLTSAGARIATQGISSLWQDDPRLGANLP